MAEVKYELVKFKKSTIIIRELHGMVHAEDIINSFKYILEKYDVNNILGIITDLDHAKFGMNIREIQSILAYINQNPVLFAIKLAVIVSTPKKVIFPILAKTKLKKLNVKPFTTKEAAVAWLN